MGSARETRRASPIVVLPGEQPASRSGDAARAGPTEHVGAGRGIFAQVSRRTAAIAFPTVHPEFPMSFASPVRTITRSFVALGAMLVALSLPSATVRAQAAPAGLLAVGTMAPDFTVSTVTKDGRTAEPFTLSKHRGETVVLAFFPKARTSGCTAQMHTYRDKYATLFKNGQKIRLIGISTDTEADLTAWAKDDGFQFAFGADTERKVGQLYGAARDGGFHNRFLYVIGPDGKISYATSFRPLAQDAYDTLDAEIRKVAR
jgi:peroxiredoxin Q/BCP